MVSTASPLRLSDTPVTLRHAPPALGQHTDEVLAERLGLDAARWTKLDFGVDLAGDLAGFSNVQIVALTAALASLGMMAYQAYQAWQRQQASAPQQAIQTVDQLEGPEAEAHSHGVLRALIAAAKADGKIDAQEQQQKRTGLAR